MNRTKLTAGIFASAVVLLAGIGVGTANAGPRLSIDTAPSTITLPVPGGLQITITTAPGGVLKDVNVDAGAYTAVDGSATDHRVTLEDTTNGVQLVVRTKNNEQRITARTDDFAKFLGSGTWVGDPFGDGVTTTIAYTVGGDETAPTVTIDSVDPAALAPEAPTSSTSSDDEDGSVSARASVRLVSGGQSRMFTVKVEVHSADASDDDDDESGASLRITLGRFKGVDQAIADLVGQDLSWTAMLCDGTQAVVPYQIDAAGNFVVDEAAVSPAPSRFEAEGNKIKVRFESGERVELRARVNGDQVRIDFKERIRCSGDPATVNGSVVPTTAGEDDDDDDHEDGDHHGGDDHKGDDDGGDHHGGGDD